MEAAGPNHSVQYNLIGVLSGDNNFKWDPSAQTLTVSGSLAGTAFSSLVYGPASAVDSNFTQYIGATGKIIKDSGISFDTDPTLSANSNARIASQQAVKAYADQLLEAANAMVYKGAIDASSYPNYPAADAGWTYIISVAGKIGGASGPDVEIGDMIICKADGTPSGDQAAVGVFWNIIEHAGPFVSGPVSATDSHVALFDGATGQLIKDGGAYSGIGGSDTHIQVNDGGVFYGDANFTRNKTTKLLTQKGSVMLGSGTQPFLILPDIPLLTGADNAVAGTGAGSALTSGAQNSFFGAFAGAGTTIGTNNFFAGYRAGDANTSGSQNVFIGQDAGGANLTGNANVFVGANAGLINIGSNNTFLGFGAGDSCSAGFSNVAIGKDAGSALTTSSGNVFIGVNAGANITSGSSNIMLGINSQGASSGTSQTFVAGSAGSPINNVYFGKGMTNATPTPYAINGTAGTGTNIFGGQLNLAGGQSTGTGIGGSISFLTSPAGVAGTATNALVERMSIGADGTIEVKQLATLTIKGNIIAPVELQWKVFSESTTVTVGDGQYIGMIPASMNGYDLTSVAAYVTSNSTVGNISVQIRNITQSADMLTTPITIDANEPTSYTAATQPVIDTGNDDVATGDLIAIDVDSAGTSAKGLGVVLTFRKP